MKQKFFIGISGLLIIVISFVVAVDFSWAQPPPSYQPTPYSSGISSSPPSNPPPAPHGIPSSTPWSSYSRPCSEPSPKIVQKNKKKVAKLMKKLKGTWQQAKTVYNGSCAECPYKMSAPQGNKNYYDYFKVTFKDNKAEGFCTTHWTNPLDETKPHCDPPLDFYTDGTFFAKDGRLTGFMKLNGSQLEFYERGMGGYTKFVLDKKK